MYASLECTNKKTRLLFILAKPYSKAYSTLLLLWMDLLNTKLYLVVRVTCIVKKESFLVTRAIAVAIRSCSAEFLPEGYWLYSLACCGMYNTRRHHGTRSSRGHSERNCEHSNTIVVWRGQDDNPAETTMKLTAQSLRQMQKKQITFKALLLLYETTKA